jgi:hypothetical protein
MTNPAQASLSLGKNRNTEFYLHIPNPAIDLLLGLVLGDAVALLNLADQLDAASFDGGEVVVGQLAPLLLNLAAQLSGINKWFPQVRLRRRKWA